MKYLKFSVLLIFFSVLFFTKSVADDYKAKQTLIAPIIDGNDSDACWTTAVWSEINQVWDPQNATPGTSSDFTGHYKAVWTPDKLYVLMRITDDKLTFWNQNKNPLVDYYKTDCPEIFIDENRSKGDHQCNYNAFAYHISMIYNVVDSDVNCQAQLFNDVLKGARVKIGNTYYWEFELNVYTDGYKLGASNNPKANLFKGKILGFSVAYNDSDDSWERERMYGSQLISPPHPIYGTNVSYIDASYFGTLELVAADIATGIENEKLSDAYLVYPNPTSDKLIIKTEEDQIGKIILSDSKGMIVYTGYHSINEHSIDVKYLSEGLYYLRIQTGSNLRIQKITVLK